MIKKILIGLLGLIELVAAWFFWSNGQTDIQIGFAIAFAFLGLRNLFDLIG